MKNKIFIVLMLIITGFTCDALAGGCRARAAECEVSCGVQAPPGGSAYCYSGSDFVECTSITASGNIQWEIKRSCEDPGGTLSDVMCFIYPFLCGIGGSHSM